MSYSSWHEHGYGICLENIAFDSVERVESLLSYAPNLKSKVHNWFEDCQITDPKIEDYLDYDQDFYLGMATILREVILESEGIELLACKDYDDRCYLIYPPKYPWYMEKDTLEMTEEKIRWIIDKYLRIITDSEFEFDYQSVENGG